MGTYSLLIDLGTTTIAFGLYDDDQKKCLNFLSMENPQKIFGQDVISRIKACMEGKSSEQKDLVINAMKDGLLSLCKTSGISKESVNRIIIGANTTMIHILLGYDVTPLSKAPFKVSEEPPAPFIYEKKSVEIIPWASAFIGGDIVSGLRYIEHMRKENSDEGAYIFMDLGTNGEMVLSSDDELFATAVAAGPAFEGGDLSCGVAGIPGAIKGVKLNGFTPKFDTVGDRHPVGICGAGAVSIVSELIKNGYVMSDGVLTGRFPDEGLILSTHSATSDRHPIIFTADDMHRILLAGAAVAAGTDTLLKAAKLDYPDISSVYLAGGLGYHIDVNAAIDIGLFGGFDPGIIKSVGNSCLLGLIQSASSCTCPDRPVPKMHIINLGISDFFKEKYIERLKM